MERLKEVLAIVNNKGGVGKTTTAVYLAEALYRRDWNLRILVIDLDSQCNASKLMGWESEQSGKPTVFNALSQQQPLPIYDSRVKKHGDGGVFLCPGHKYMESIDTALHLQRPAEKVLMKCFANDIANHTTSEISPDITEAFDYIIIDCPPQLGDITYNAMMVSDSVLIPVQAEMLAVMGLANSIETFQQCRRDMKPELKCRGVLLTMLDERTAATREFIEYVKDTYGEAVFSSRIRRCTKVVEAQAIGKNLYDHAPKCTSALDYDSLANEIMHS